MSMFNSKKNLQSDEQGIVAIVVTMIIMIVLTLIVTGFAQLARREQRATLDRQLASQAFYAAESGINAARKALEDGDFTAIAGLNSEKSDCPKLSTAANVDSLEENQIGLNISYPCLLIDNSLENSIVDLSTDTSDIQDLKSYSAANPATAVDLTKLQVSWKDTDINVKGVNSSVLLPAAGAGWGDKIGMIRLDIVPYTIPALGFSSSDLKSNLHTIFLRPKDDTTDTPALPLASMTGGVSPVHCKITTGVCSVIIELPVGYSQNLVRMKSIYRPSTVVLCANECNGETVFIGNQVEVDSTGKAGDILKRLKVRIPKKPDSGSTDIPEFTLDSAAGICKKTEVSPLSFTTGGCTY